MGFGWGLVFLWLATRGSQAITVNVTLLLYDERLCATNSSLFEAAASLAVAKSQLPASVSMRMEYVHTEDDDDCSETGGLLEIFQVMNDPNVGAVIGSVASPVCQAAVSLAALRSKPFVSWSCSGLTASARHSATFARTVPPAWHAAQALVSLIRHFRWKYSVVVTTDDGQWPPLGYEIDMVLREARHIVRNFIILHQHGTLREAKERLAGIGPLVKAVILCMDVTSTAMYSVMQAAEELGMINGGYTFLALHVLYTLRPQALPNIPNNHLLRSLFIMTFISPNATYLSNWDAHHEFTPLITYSDNATEADDYIFQQVYDSVALFSSALKRTVSESRRRPFNLTHLLRHTKDVTFQGFLGPVIMNDKGDRDVTYVLLSYDASRERFRSAVWVSNFTVVEDIDRDWYANRLVPPDPPCILYEEDCFIEVRGVALSPAHIVAVVFCSLLITFSAIFVAIMVRRRILQNEMTKGPNKIIILPDDLVFVSPRSLSASRKAFDFKPSESLEGMLLHHFKVTSLGWPHGRGFLKDTVPQQLNDFANLEKPDLLKGSHDSLRGKTNASSVSARPLWDESTTKARYNGDLVHVKYLHLQTFEIKNKTMKELKLLHELRHENLNPFLGLLADPQHPALIYEYCSRGSLEDIIASEDIKLDWAFKLSLLTDLVRGMRYLHSSAVRVHGSLTSRNCVIDSRWVLKITDYGLRSLLEPQNLSSMRRSAKDLLWTAPELLRDETAMWRGTQMGDVYAFGIIIQEVVVRGTPYCMLSLTPEEIIEKVKRPPPMIRPSVSKQAAPPEAINIMRQCWAEVPDMRPDFNAINEHFKKLNQGKKVNIVDTMFQMLEKYSNNLEELIRERTEQLAEEKKKTEQLLHRMLPSTVAEKLMLGMPVEPEAYEEVTIYFSDIVGFTTISAYSTPMEIVDLLNDLYTCFDATINAYDVYKVETIGDAYMVVGGLPVRIEDHACQVASMALDLLHQSARFQIRHMPSTPLKLRIGVHTGPCCAGVVGLTMPRYCLFGDTVNTASRMESTGQAFRIHISETTKAKLDEAGGYRLQYRGETELKGKGKAMTFWLLGKEGFDKELPVPSDDEGDSHGLDEEVVRRGRLSSVSYQQQALFLSTPPLSQLARGLSVPGPRLSVDHSHLSVTQWDPSNKMDVVTLQVRPKPYKESDGCITLERSSSADDDTNSNTKTDNNNQNQRPVTDNEVKNASCRSISNNTNERFNRDLNGNSPTHCATSRTGDCNGNITSSSSGGAAAANGSESTSLPLTASPKRIT